ncbi:MAG: hypothetical protein NVSMB19_25690 [Vulcanimicrobiaceae bacterium]
MNVARELLDRAHAAGATTLAVVGTAKNAGKSVVVAALVRECERSRHDFALCSTGRDGEATDALDAAPKPRFFLRPGALVATAAGLVPRTPALEIVRVTDERSALGAIVLGRVRAPGFLEIAGPPRASAARRIVGELRTHASLVIVDGAVDRIAALRDGADAIVVAAGASGAPSLARAVDDVAALVARLSLPPVGDAVAPVRVAGALTARLAAEHAGAFGRTRALVVADPTHVAFGGRTLLELLARVDVRCERTLRPIACTVAPFGRERAFEPRAFARAVAARTGLPTYDVFAQSGA